LAHILEHLEIKTSAAELDALGVPNSLRDLCVDVYIPLHKCRYAKGWQYPNCKDEMHEYERCNYELYESLKKKKQDEIAARKAASQQ